ncbi:gliding motility-associated C-terminal domain-containing protein [Aquimarina sp. MMG016]|uniref:T9SS type B sorting domain-containing protein n=1 Tax=Aquimarina sp. MMG016 TaxID=2822690 RepID=UPI001B3A28B9|nr:gliding motility-associated C-terminal domain-containing protein [Aquimarina sp. MMG016]MBQ4820051.1 gliding motility-associated C-terminal domain-containing protein [Aquimarina sp. MMG016]
MKKRLNLSLIICTLILFITNDVMAQREITAPTLEVVGEACGTPTNSFTFTANLLPGPAFPSNNEFVLELSDPDGNFDTGQNIILGRIIDPTLNDAAGSGLKELRFDNVLVPIDANSDNYRVRVNLTEADPDDFISGISDAIPFHFFNDNLEIILNDRNNVTFCRVTSFTKVLDVRVLDENQNDIDPNIFTWKWFTITGINTESIIPGETGASLTVTQPGRFVARVDLGRCQNFFDAFGAVSNRVTVELKDVDDVVITNGVDPLEDFSFCPGDIKELTSGLTDFSNGYQWFKDGVALPGEIGPSIILPDNDFGGDYYLEVTFSEECTVRSDPPTTVTNEGSSITEPLPERLIQLPNPLTLEVTTDAPGGDVTWFAQSSIVFTGALDGPTTSIETPFTGLHRVEIQTNDVCDSFLVSETTIFAATGYFIEIGVQGGGDITCDQNPITLELINMFGRVSSGDPIPLTEAQIALFDFEWYKDDVATGVTSLSLTANQSAIAESYELRADLRAGGFTGIESNPIVLGPCTTAISELVPNIVTPNSDDINDTWGLPASMNNQQDVEVTIYSSNGQIDFSGVNYQNDWPQENSKSEGRNGVYYYVISKNNSVIKKGSITVRR